MAHRKLFIKQWHLYAFVGTAGREGCGKLKEATGPTPQAWELAVVAESHHHCVQLPRLITLQNEGRGGFFLPRQVFNFKQEKSHQVSEAPGGQLMLPVKCSPWGALLP